MTSPNLRAFLRRSAPLSSPMIFMVAFVPSACGGTKPAPEGPAPDPSVTAAPASSEPAAPLPAAEATPEPAGGRMAFVKCPEKRPEMCTHLYKPVCAEVDNGVRCVTTPCNSTDKKNYGNACAACADPKVAGHWPVPCEQLGNDAKP